MTESTRQKKIAKVLQGDLAELLQNTVRNSGIRGIIISVTKVRVSVDLSLAKIYISVFPSEKAKAVIKELDLFKGRIKHQVALKVKGQMRKMPDLAFYYDDSLDYIDRIERSMKGMDNPLDNPDLLDKRKKR